MRNFLSAFVVCSSPSQPQLGKNRHIYPRAFWRIYVPVFDVRTRRGGVREHGGRGGVRTCGVSEGAYPLARGHPTGAGAPCWRTTLLAKSSVLDLLRPPGRERGCAGQHGHFPVPAEQRISAGGAAGGYPLFVLRRRGEAASPGRKRATHPPQRRVSIPPRQLQAHIVQRLTLRCPRSALRQVEVPGRLRQRTLCVLVV